ncbi:mannosyl-3-phosphoglycerate phosphatase-related protein [Citrobacter amalonaticus]|uniref:mannosyl-3-phosphoglycerate phosphatase-related protein n=1 Tax=Citrobacter amalonaticus TaxID=35703 RepID=UPI00300D042A
MLSLDDPLLIFTDLDGTLLDSHTYDWQPAAAWLARLREKGVPVILSSSKTAAEMLQIQKQLGLQGLPLIAENGAVIELDSRWHAHPDFPRLITGASHDEISAVLNKLRERAQFKFTTFDDVDESAIAEWTGLTHAQASLTRLHEASVTLIWRDSDERMAEFSRQLDDVGLQFVHGARFWHVLESSAGKDHAANGLIDRYQRQWKRRPVTVGLGDGPNDAPLLEAMDYAIIVKGLNREGVILRGGETPQVYRTQHEGPEGWREGMTHLFPPPYT